MNRPLLLITTISLLTAFSFGQQPTIQTQKEIIKYENGRDEFYVCITNPSVKFNDSLDYYWYNESSGIKNTKGGIGGKFLHGKYQFFDKNGNLSKECNYYLGLEDGHLRTWDEKGNILETVRMKRGVMVYFKTTNEDGYIVEWTGEMFKKNSVKNIYNKWGQLLETSTFVEPFKFHYKSYYENTNPSIIQEENTQWIGEMYDGTYKANYKDGMPKVIGHFSDRVRDSVWTFYDEDGTLTRIKFKKYQETYPNGKIKVRGSKFYDDKTQAWLPDYDWWYYKENGDIEKMEKYKFGVLQEN